MCRKSVFLPRYFYFLYIAIFQLFGMNQLPYHHFAHRHIGTAELHESETMLQYLQAASLDELINQTVPASIRLKKPLQLPEALTEQAYLQHIRSIAQRNKIAKSYIGLGYYGTFTPPVIQRNIFENPGWYTQYTPYQAEIAQGRLEALLNFQTVVSDLTALPIANASLLDEATAAAEAMYMLYQHKNKNAKADSEAAVFLVSEHCFPATIEVVKTRAAALGINVIVAPPDTFVLNAQVFGILLQYPADNGAVYNYHTLCQNAHEQDIYVCVAADLLSLTLLSPPGEWGVDVAVGSTQRFGVPMGYGGPHAAYFATRDEFKRLLPGRIIGVSIDRRKQRALRMALQTREQHIRREKATSNICTAQALLAIMAGMYAVYHGANGLKKIAQNIHQKAQYLEHLLKECGFKQNNAAYFDTLSIKVKNEDFLKIKKAAEKALLNFRYKSENEITISVDETTSEKDIEQIVAVFAKSTAKKIPVFDVKKAISPLAKIQATLQRSSTYLQQPVFNSYHSETELMRYIKKLENRDLSLTHSMIALGSCTMKLNAAVELMPVSYPEFSQLHPFAPLSQTKGYQQIFAELEQYLCEITALAACSLQPNSGAQGEYAGLLTIRNYHKTRGQAERTIALIPSSAHGTNPASAVLCGLEVVVVKCDENGNIDVEDLRQKAEQHRKKLAVLMLTYPSTHGVFEEQVQEICSIVHQNGGQVYMDGANMNAQVGLTAPGVIGADVCHLNLHKTFAIPHGGGGPGAGPICVAKHLKPYLPSHGFLQKNKRLKTFSAVSAAPWGSANILLISYAYIRLLGAKGLTEATRYAILNANYIKNRLQHEYEVLYMGKQGRVAHELILDMRVFKNSANIEVEDIAKRLMDYGFHAPTVSFPVAGTLMIEPTESESKAELDRFCDAMLAIKAEIMDIIKGDADKNNNVLKNAPHPLDEVCADTWNYPYSREKAAFPLPFVRDNKFWAFVARVNGSHGDRHLICTCAPTEAYETAAT